MKVDLYQKVNSGLAILLISSLTFLVVLYYLTHKASAIGQNFAQYNTLQE